MPSPFRGMNPYLEQSHLWRDFHNSFLVALRATLVPQLPDRYLVEYEEQAAPDEDGADGKARRLVVRDSKSNAVVTVVELLSPSNKASGADRDKYLEKRGEVLTSAAHFVELDLHRGGKRMPVRALPECDYYALVSRAWERPRIGLWPVSLRDPLPAIPVPLHRGDPEPLVSLKQVLDRTYDDAGYARRIYQTPPEPPLAGADTDWATALAAAR